MVEWMNKQKALGLRARHSEPMTKRKVSSACRVCCAEIVPGEKCFFYEVGTAGSQYPVRMYVCEKCHCEANGADTGVVK